MGLRGFRGRGRALLAEIVVLNGVCAGTVFVLPDIPTVLGRSPESHLQIGDPWISSMHAMFERRGPEVWVIDLESRNGTFLADERVNEAKVPDGALLRFGKTEVRFAPGTTWLCFSDQVMPALADEGVRVVQLVIPGSIPKLQVTGGLRYYDYKYTTRTATDFPLANTVFGGAAPDGLPGNCNHFFRSRQFGFQSWQRVVFWNFRPANLQQCVKVNLIGDSFQ